MNKKMLISIALIIVMLLNYILPISLAVVEADDAENTEESIDVPAEDTSDNSTDVTPATDGAITFNGALYNGLKYNLLEAGVKGEFNDAQRTMKLSQEDINKVTTLKLSNYGISDLTGLDTFKNVTYVDLSANELDSDSHLETLNSMNLSYLDLSSNGISDVSMITNIDSIKTLNLHNQKFNLVEIIEIDTEVESDQKTEATFALPQIFKYGGRLKLDWLPETTYAATGSTAPHAIWKNFDGENITIQTGESTDTGYTPYYGMTKISLEVDDSTNTLYNSKINLYYITVSSEQRGIIFKDNNLYKAVKEQLTKGQTTNTDLTKYTAEANLYDRAYDEAKVLVIDISTLINKIPSLTLTDKKIKDLTGLEKFVGLEKELDLEGNYIESIDQIIELKVNKLEEEAKLQAKVNKQIAYIKESVEAIDSAKETIKSENTKAGQTQTSITELETAIATLKTEIANLKTEISTLNTNLTTYKAQLETAKTNLTAKQNEQKALNEEVANLNTQLASATKDTDTDALKAQIASKEALVNAKKVEVEMAQTEVTNAEKLVSDTESKITTDNSSLTTKQNELTTKQKELTTKESELKSSLTVISTNQNTVDTQTGVLETRMARLYEIYQKSYKFTKVATVELATLTDDEFSSLTYESAKSIYEKQVSRFSSIESNLASYESSFIIDCYSIPTVTNTTITDETTGVSTTKSVDIENPISTYFKDFVKNHETWTLADMKSFLTEVKYISSVLEMMNYCTIERLYNGTKTCYAEEYLTKTTEERNWAGQSTTDLEKISKNLSTIKKSFTSKYKYSCEGAVSFSVDGNIYKIAKKFASTTSAEVSAYVKIPMLKVLNIKRNLIESIDGIEYLNELQELYVGDNELVTVDGVDWSQITDLKILDLSYNDISEIKCLEVISSLEELDLSKNLISGAYNFEISGMPNLQALNMSYNSIDDISLLEVQLAGTARDAGYSDVTEYLEAGKFDVKFYGQVLSMQLSLVQMGSTTYVDLPNIFRQAEELDNVRTSFGTNSIFGNVTNDGKQALLDTSKLGEQTAIVSIVDTKYSDTGICSQTYCTINYTVTAQEVVEPDDSSTSDGTTTPDNSTNTDNSTTPTTPDNSTNTDNSTTPTTPDNSTNTDNSTNPTTPDNSANTSTVEYGYEVSGENLTGISPKTTVSAFAKKLTSDYNVIVVKENENGENTAVESGYVGTGMIAIVYVDEDNIVGVYEIVVQGDVNGDGLANATDSNLIKAYRSETINLTGVYKEAADINQDGSVNAIDSRLLLYHRAEIKGYIL